MFETSVGMGPGISIIGAAGPTDNIYLTAAERNCQSGLLFKMLRRDVTDFAWTSMNKSKQVALTSAFVTCPPKTVPV